MKNSFSSPRMALARLSSAVLLSVVAFSGLAQAAYTEAWNGRIYRDKYVISNNIFNGDSAGEPYTQAIYDWTRPDGRFSWGTKWKWPWGNGSIKSYPAAVLGWNGPAGWVGHGLPVRVSDRKNIRSSWYFKLSSDNNQPVSGGFNVAYDLWFHSSPPTDRNAPFNATDEIMIWLYRQDQGPASFTGQPVDEVTINNITWQLYRGYVGTWNVYSYLPKHGNLTSIENLDITAFINHVSNKGWIHSQQYLTAIEAGVEMKYSDTSRFNYFTSDYYNVDIW